MDLCFVPAQHAAQERLPAVSGSSGHLVVARPHPHDDGRHWPGQVFADTTRDYGEAMRRYAEATRERLVPGHTPRPPVLRAPTLSPERRESQAARYRVREQRKREDLAWRAAKTAWRERRQAYAALPPAERQAQRATYLQAKHLWRATRQQRQQTRADRALEDQAWHARTQVLYPAMEGATPAWVAILVITDNCTRQCLGLPLFGSGPRVSSAEVVAALKALLPPELEFVISDQGTHFRSQRFAELARRAEFVHIPVYRHRPESNGIAERLVLTLKGWLQGQSWEGAEALAAVLGVFRPEYNDRPHQGLAIPGLSPNEFAHRVWLM